VSCDAPTAPCHRQEDAFTEEEVRYLLANARASWLTAC